MRGYFLHYHPKVVLFSTPRHAEAKRSVNGLLDDRATGRHLLAAQIPTDPGIDPAIAAIGIQVPITDGLSIFDPQAIEATLA